MSFADRLVERYRKINTLLCVGLDPRPEDITVSNSNPTEIAEQLLKFVKGIVDATCDLALAYKANAAYFESFGLGGYTALLSLREYIPKDIPFILDAKRGDIAESAVAYARSVFNHIHADAVTVNGYLGSDGVFPFAEDPSQGVFVLAHTSNPSAVEIQDLQLLDNEPVYIRQAKLAQQWNTNNNIGLVVGATGSYYLKRIRKVCPQMWFLVPGIGAQGGDLIKTLHAGITDFGGLLINISRGISQAQEPRNAALEYVQQMRDFIQIAAGYE